MSDTETTEHVVHQHWEGSTAAESYPMASTAWPILAGKGQVATSVPGHNGGDDSRWSPEDLFGAALSTCFMYTFLALAKKVRVDVRAYDDTVEMFLVTEERQTRIARAVLAPRITLAPGSNAAKAATMFEKAHKYCVIANSTSAEVVLRPTFVEADG
jgi:organic hydroperoxide reductase OsmC/OhrA